MLNITPNPQSGSDTQLACNEQMNNQTIRTLVAPSENYQFSKDQKEFYNDLDMVYYDTDETAQSLQSAPGLYRQESIEDA